MRITILNQVNDHWLEAHCTGCAHLRRAPLRYQDQTWTENHETLTDAAASIASDFIAEESMTLEDALRNIHFAPCVKLPLGNDGGRS